MWRSQSRDFHPRALAVALVLLALPTIVPRDARADDDPIAAARVHYDTGTGAFVRGDFKTAAEEFATADRLAPSPVALSAALDAVLRADQAVLGMELVQRASRAPNDPATVALVTRARARFAKRTGRVRVTCTPAPCTAKLDGSPLELGVERIALVGPHVVAIERAGKSDERRIDLSPEGRADVVIEGTTSTPNPNPIPIPTSTPSPTPTEPSSGVSPVWFFSAAGLTAILGGAAVLSALDTKGKHDDYAQSGCDLRGGVACGVAAGDGIAAQRRTNVLLALAGAGAVATAVLGILMVRWRDEPRATVAAGLVGGGLVGGGPGAFVRVKWR